MRVKACCVRMKLFKDMGFVIYFDVPRTIASANKYTSKDYKLSRIGSLYVKQFSILNEVKTN